ncbi:hypothetical protein FMGBMHLM_0958 [Methylobacterium aerolatum]|nr:hypothetical protein FMGBMHLM_0958 [Methylobacterium aerolatum]
MVIRLHDELRQPFGGRRPFVRRRELEREGSDVILMSVLTDEAVLPHEGSPPRLANPANQGFVGAGLPLAPSRPDS